ncbi:hypothetical protein GQ53DRAFT_423790 [Thozetella sp. PMI_491]|nr:hypothetical protein GQ53DRAFT_423790 [Thozetella sp. PMI_491]
MPPHKDAESGSQLLVEGSPDFGTPSPGQLPARSIACCPTKPATIAIVIASSGDNSLSLPLLSGESCCTSRERQSTETSQKIQCDAPKMAPRRSASIFMSAHKQLGLCSAMDARSRPHVARNFGCKPRQTMQSTGAPCAGGWTRAHNNPSTWANFRPRSR